MKVTCCASEPSIDMTKSPVAPKYDAPEVSTSAWVCASRVLPNRGRVMIRVRVRVVAQSVASDNIIISYLTARTAA